MVSAIGFLELNSIAKGIEITDTLIKAADVKLIFARASCPGKFYIMFSGSVSAVNASMNAGLSIPRENVVDHVIIPQIDSQVLYAINQAGAPSLTGALGVMEFFSVTAAVYAADAAAKAARVSLIDIRIGTGIGGKSFVTLSGEVSAVRAAVDAGITNEHVKGLVVGSVVIPKPSAQLYESLY